jgi:aspartyl-tRNA(Asn)/glutamyl-tRNA(Gln) amidotransferase subunit C
MVDKKTVEYVSGLARIAISQESKEYLARQLSKILDYIDKLKEIDTDRVEPMREVFSQGDVFRADQAEAFGDRERILDNVPLREGDYFKIPKVIE